MWLYAHLKFQVNVARTRIEVIQDIAESADLVSDDKRFDELIDGVCTYYLNDEFITSRPIQKLMSIARSNAVVYIEYRRLLVKSAGKK